MTLNNLEGAKNKEMECFFISKSEDISKISFDIAGTAAGDSGAINVWLDDDGHFRCESMAYMRTIEKMAFSDVDKAKKWVKKWLKKIQ